MNNTTIVYINLTRSKQRRIHIEKELNREGLTFKRFNAIDGKNISYKDLLYYPLL